MNYSVKDFKPFERNTLKGFFTVVAGSLEIEGFTYHEKNGSAWVGMPAKQYQDDNGETGWYPLVFIKDKDRFKKFVRWAVSEVEKIMPADGAGTEPEQDEFSNF
jgi:hypothetical protein